MRWFADAALLNNDSGRCVARSRPQATRRRLANVAIAHELAGWCWSQQHYAAAVAARQTTTTPTEEGRYCRAMFVNRDKCNW